MASKRTELVILSNNANDLAFSSSDDAKRALKQIENHLAGGLNGAHDITSVQVRDSAVAAAATITLASFAAGTVLLINGVPFTALSGTAVAANNEFDIAGTDTEDAAALAAAINASTTAGISGIVTATSADEVVTVTAAQPGASGNGITIENLGVVATATITAASVDNNDAIAINGVTLTAKTTVTDTDVQWDTDGSNSVVAAALAACINGTDETGINLHVRALARAAVVHLFAKRGGTIGNSITLTTTDATDLAIAVTNGRLAGGTITQHEGVQASATVTLASVANAETVIVNGVTITAHTNTQANNQFSIAGSDTEDAAALALAINNSTTAALKDVVATSADAVVTIAARKGGIAGNTITLSSAAGTMVCSAARLASGAVPTVAAIAGGVGTQSGGGARLGSGSNDTAILYTL